VSSAVRVPDIVAVPLLQLLADLEFVPLTEAVIVGDDERDGAITERVTRALAVGVAGALPVALEPGDLVAEPESERAAVDVDERVGLRVLLEQPVAEGEVHADVVVRGDDDAEAASVADGVRLVERVKETDDEPVVDTHLDAVCESALVTLPVTVARSVALPVMLAVVQPLGVNVSVTVATAVADDESDALGVTLRVPVADVESDADPQLDALAPAPVGELHALAESVGETAGDEEDVTIEDADIVDGSLGDKVESVEDDAECGGEPLGVAVPETVDDTGVVGESVDAIDALDDVHTLEHAVDDTLAAGPLAVCDCVTVNDSLEQGDAESDGAASVGEAAGVDERDGEIVAELHTLSEPVSVRDGAGDTLELRVTDPLIDGDGLVERVPFPPVAVDVRKGEIVGEPLELAQGEIDVGALADWLVTADVLPV
jgi:hypothetical protein